MSHPNSSLSRMREAPMGRKERIVWSIVATVLLATIGIVVAKAMQGIFPYQI